MSTYILLVVVNWGGAVMTWVPGFPSLEACAIAGFTSQKMAIETSWSCLEMPAPRKEARRQ